MRSIFMKYHWIRFFFQWLKLRTKMFVAGISAIRWGIKHKCYLSFCEMIDMLKWRSWNWYKINGTYLLEKENDVWLITGNQLNEVMLHHYASRKMGKQSEIIF